ncbi:MAG: ABC transporter substrate-binding protein [Clostridia bacterium]|nr:ABC transporter substrate-binding protein [Clostridia bacterium]
MRKFCALLALIITLGCGALLAGCSETEAEVAVDENFPALVDTRGTEVKMNTVFTLKGNEVTYNMNTRRIVCVFGSQDVVAFGVKLLAYESSTETTGYESFYEGATKLQDGQPFSEEEILSFDPELIFVNQNMSNDNIETLNKIAPTIPLYTDSDDFSVRLNYIGSILGLEESARTLIEYADGLKDKMLAEMRSYGLQDKTLTIFTYLGNISIVPERGWFMNTIIYDYLGVKRLDNVREFMQDESGSVYEPISAENLRNYEGDLVMFAGFGEKKITTYVSENEGWKMLKAVKEDRVGVIDLTPYAQKGVILLYNQYYQIMQALKTAAKITD